MSAAHLHLLTNHVPIIGTFVLVAIFAWGWSRRSDEVVLLGLWGVLVVTAAGLFTLITGEPTEELVEDLPGFSHDAMEAHEGAAKLSMIPLGVAALAALGSLAVRWRKKAVPRWAAPVTLLLVALGAAAMAWTGYLGGGIRHSELEQVLEATERERDDGS